MVYEIYDYDGFKMAIDEICAILSSHAISSEKIYDCRLISHELIGNVLQHSGGGVQLRVELKEGYLLICVKAEHVYQPPKKSECPVNDAERGRGMYLVDSFSAERSFSSDGEIIVKLTL